MAGPVFFQNTMPGDRDSRSSEPVMEPKLLSRSGKQTGTTNAKETPVRTQTVENITTIDSDKEILPSTQPSTPPLNAIPAGDAREEGHRDATKRRRILRTLCQRIDSLQQSGTNASASDEIFTVLLCTTPSLNDVYNEVADGIICDDGLVGPSTIGVLSNEEKTI